MQFATTTPTAAEAETLSIRISQQDGRFIAEWSTGRIGGRGISASAPEEIIRIILDSIWAEGTRPRKSGRPTNRKKKMERLVNSRVRVVIDIEPSGFGSLRTSTTHANIALMALQHWRTSDSVQ